MASIAFKRIKKELNELRDKNNATYGFHVELVNNSFRELKANITGPPDTPYEGGNFILEIKIPEEYPFKPPKVRFVTKIWHPNISSVTGTICLDILKDQWEAIMSLENILLSIQVLLGSAEPSEPLDAVVARQYKENPEMFKKTARHWAQVYAGAPGFFPDFDENIKKLMDMGVDEHEARTVLSSYFWDIGQAVEYL